MTVFKHSKNLPVPPGGRPDGTVSGRMLDSGLMNSPFSRESTLSSLVALVAVMVLTLVWLQYRWLGQVSEAERDRMQRMHPHGSRSVQHRF